MEWHRVPEVAAANDSGSKGGNTFMSLLIRQVSCDSELENTLETERKCNGGVTWIIMSSRFGLKKKKKTVCKDSSKSRRIAEEICGHPSMNKHFVSCVDTDHIYFLILSSCNILETSNPKDPNLISLNLNKLPT